MTAAPNYTTDGLLANVKNRYIIPASQNLYSDADLLAMMDDEMRSYIIPLINSVREDYWTIYFDQPVTNGTTQYRIPTRAAGGILRDVVFVDPNGNEIAMTRLSPAQIKATFPFGYQLPLYTFGFFLRNDMVMPYPQQAQNATQYTLRMKILQRPNNLTLSSNCGQIQIIAGNVVTLSYIDPTWTTGTLFDVIQNYPLFVASIDNVITNINSATNQITFSSLPSGVAVGDWVCPQYMSCVPQIVYEAFPMLAQRGVVTLARSLGDSQGTDLAEKEYERLKVAFLSFIEPRVQLSGQKIVNMNNPYSWGTTGVPFFR